MSALDLARAYMDVFYSGRDVEELRPILADDLVFEGPFLRCASAGEYIDSLRGDSREGMSREMLWEFEDGEFACLVYRFSKPGVETTMAQVSRRGAAGSRGSRRRACARWRRRAWTSYRWGR